jgi:hypothetical protein
LEGKYPDIAKEFDRLWYKASAPIRRDSLPDTKTQLFQECVETCAPLNNIWNTFENLYLGLRGSFYLLRWRTSKALAVRYKAELGRHMHILFYFADWKLNIPCCLRDDLRILNAVKEKCLGTLPLLSRICGPNHMPEM